MQNKTLKITMSVTLAELQEIFRLMPTKKIDVQNPLFLCPQGIVEHCCFSIHGFCSNPDGNCGQDELQLSGILKDLEHTHKENSAPEQHPAEATDKSTLPLETPAEASSEPETVIEPPVESAAQPESAPEPAAVNSEPEKSEKPARKTGTLKNIKVKKVIKKFFIFENKGVDKKVYITVNTKGDKDIKAGDLIDFTYSCKDKDTVFASKITKIK